MYLMLHPTCVQHVGDNNLHTTNVVVQHYTVASQKIKIAYRPEIDYFGQIFTSIYNLVLYK